MKTLARFVQDALFWISAVVVLTVWLGWMTFGFLIGGVAGMVMLLLGGMVALLAIFEA